MAGNLLKFTDADWKTEVLESDSVVMVDFWAHWCQPCLRLGPTIEKLAETYNGKVKVGKMDTDANPVTPPQYGISGIPAVLFFKGGQVVDRIVGLQSETKYKDALERLGVTA